ncbi:MAG: rhodanese-like domain-containing protein [Arenicellales bacterium]|nr:rhodanese-like domain-containing protein [Arenicellales bacterium]
MQVYVRKLFTIVIISITAFALGSCGEEESKTISMSGDNFVRVAASIARQEDRVTADQLARWIAEETHDFITVDIRPENEFNAGHIKGSLNISLPELVSDEGRKKVASSETVVVYSNGSEYAAKAATMLRLVNVQASFLLGGYNHWGRYILNPEEGAHSQVDGELLTYAERRALSCSFCGPEAVAGYSPPVQPISAGPQDSNQLSSQGPKKLKKKSNKSIVSEGC